MILTKRSLKIINLFLTGNKFTIDELADFFSITNRTVANNIKTIKDFLKSNNLNSLVENNGVYYIKSKDFRLISHLISKEVITVEERKEYIILKLLTDNLITLNPISEELGITRRALNYDMIDVKEFFSNKNIELIPVAGKGVTLVGKEADLRQLLSQFIEKLLIKKGNINKIFQKFLKVFNENCSISLIDRMLMEVTRDMNITLPPESFYYVIGIILSGKLRKNFKDDSLKIENNSHSQKYQNLKEKLLNNIHIPIEDYETDQIISVFLDSDVETYKGEYKLKPEIEEFLAILKEKLNINFTIDENFLMILSYSFKLSNYKAEFNISQHQKKISHIPDSCENIFEIVNDFTKKVFRQFHADDLLFITLLLKNHILKSDGSKTSRKSILIIDNSIKHFLGKLVSKYLKNFYKINNITIISSYELDCFFSNNMKPDLILTLDNSKINTNIPIIKLDFAELWPNLNFLEYYF